VADEEVEEADPQRSELREGVEHLAGDEVEPPRARVEPDLTL
jgi:hypothetical protein